MKAFIVFAVIVASVSAQQVILNSHLGLASPIALSSPLTVTAAQIPVARAVIAPAATASQYHAQDELGQFSYGYAGGPSAKAETKTADGVTRGGYSYIDANGLLQTVNYVSDAAGFRVAATNLPVGPSTPGAIVPVPGPIPQQVAETPEVAAARAAHLVAHAKAAKAAADAPDN